MTEKERLVQKGINYLRVISTETRNGNRFGTKELAEDLGIAEAHIKAAITAAKEQKEKATKPFTVKLSQPFIQIGREFATGEKQAIDSIEIEVLKPIRVDFERENYSEYTFMAPIKVRVRRR